MRKLALLLIACCMMIVQVWAQNKTVTGKVTDAKGNGLPSVSVEVKGTNIGTITKQDGSYSISIPPTAKTLTFSSVDLAAKEIIIGSQSTINTSLSAGTGNSLDEVVVVGYQTLRRQDVVGSASVVNTKEIAQKPIANFTQLLQGTAPGLQVTGASGRPGAAAYIRIRGTGSINASSQPLIIVDGMQVPASTYSLINPDDIEEFSILKDASATAIYGSRGANGVILLTTKRGRGAPVVTYSFQYGENKYLKLKNLELMNSAQKLQYEYEAGFQNNDLTSLINRRIAAGGLPSGSTLLNITGAQRQLLWDSLSTIGAGDWRNYMLQKGKVATHQVSIAGSGERFNYFLSFENSDQDGVLYHNFFKRKGGRINVEFKVNDWFRVGTNSAAYYTRENTVRELYNGQAAYTSALLLNPYEPVYNNDGSFNITHLGQNAMETVDRNPDILDRLSLIESAFGEATAFKKHLTLRTQIGLNYNTLNEEYYLQPGSYLAQTLGYNQKRDNGNKELLYVFTNTANWNQTIAEDHNINLLAGTEFNKDKFYSFSLTQRGFASASLTTLENGSSPTGATTSRSDFSLISYFAKAGYNFKRKYYLDLSGRRDGSSRFGKNNRFANFYAIGASWDVKAENFMKSVNVVDRLRIRGSFGTSGNNNGIGNYQALGTYAYNVNYNALPAASPSNLPNPNLTWEQKEKKDLGIDLGFFKNRLNVTVDYYNDKTKNLLYPVNVSATTGFSSYTGNIGAIVNKGYEISISGDIVRTKDLTVNLYANYTNNNNKITSLYSDNVPVPGGISVLKVGEPAYTYKLVKWAGVNPSTGKNEFYKLDGTKTDAYSAGDAVLLNGKSSQAKYYGAFGTTINFKGLDLGVRFYYSGGNYIMNYVYSAGASEGESIGENQFTDALNYWKNKGDIVTMANLKDLTQRATYDSDKYLEKGDYINLRDITLGYNLDSKLANKVKLKGVRIFVQGTNLWIGTKFRGLPESGESNREQTTYTVPGQVTLFSYPQFRSITGGVTVKF